MGMVFDRHRLFNLLLINLLQTPILPANIFPYPFIQFMTGIDVFELTQYIYNYCLSYWDAISAIQRKTVFDRSHTLSLTRH